MLSIDEYDRAEASARRRASYPAIRAFHPAAFAMVNFPARVTDESELIRYSDIMYELADRDAWYRKMLYSLDEQRLILDLSATIEALTRDLFGKAVQPFMCLFPPIPLLRAVEALAGGRRMTVLEIGPGSGYLGAYLLMRGYKYAATDNTQALYLWQHRLFGRLAPGLVDHATDTAPISLAAPATLIPWWRFAEMHTSPLPVDLIVCEAAMGEMDIFGVNYIIRLAALMLRDSPLGAFLFRNIGEWRVNTLSYVESRFAAAGFIREERDGVTMHSLRPLNIQRALQPRGGTKDSRTAEQFLPLAVDKLLPSYAFFDFLKLRAD